MATKYFNNCFTAFILFFVIFTEHTLAVYLWHENEWSEERDKQVIRILGDALNKEKSSTWHNIPNVAISRLSLTIRDVSEEKILNFTLPRFFLSGWDKKEFTIGFGTDVETFIRKKLVNSYADYVPFMVTMIGDYYGEGEDAKSSYYKVIQKLLSAPIKEEDFPKDYYHSEQAAFLYIQTNIEKILEETNKFIGAGQKIVTSKLDIISYWNTCGTGGCEGTKCAIEKEVFESINPTTFSITLRSIPPEAYKRNMKEEEPEEAQKRQKSSNSTSSAEENESHQLAEIKKLNVGIPSPAFVAFLFEAEEYKKYTSKSGNSSNTLFEKMRGNLNDKTKASGVYKDLSIVKGIAIQKKDSRLESLCDLLNAYVHICVDTNDLRKEASKIAEKMNEIIDKRKTLEETRKQEREQERAKPSFLQRMNPKSTSSSNTIQEVDIHKDVAKKFLGLLPSITK